MLYNLLISCVKSGNESKAVVEFEILLYQYFSETNRFIRKKAARAALSFAVFWVIN